MQPLVLLLAFILLPGAEAGEIIGGQEARPHSHPYMAFLQVESPQGLSSCGGFLVREDFVMTAGHCWGSTINVTLGAHNIEKQERTQQQITVLRAIRHPRYNNKTALNDIMLLQLRNRIRRNQFVRPVALPNAGEKPRPGALCTVAGWGWISLHGWSDKLQEVQLRVQSDRKCTRRFPSYCSRTQICVGDPRQKKAVFKGDSGDPLVCNNVAQGIVSYGDKENGTAPDVFTRIASYLSWIKRIMRRFKQQNQTETPPSSPCD
ncbi:PREDICTED: cathepsin G [Chinchilla lanigera]|uniref:Cathepsin G n=1 Tax=Chinchilla lanigera TaxID=34839 RepID=A0A8C2VNL6_CHILA|nr:PREDICTED: cathepsin G [Chinchilla lanigera]